MANAQFPEGSPLQDVYPYGFSNGDPADGEYMLNAVYRNIPAVHPGHPRQELQRGRRRDQAGCRGVARDPGRVLRAGQPRGLQGRSSTRWAASRSTSTSRSRSAATPPQASRRTTTSHPGRTSTSPASRRCGSRAGGGAPTTTSAWSGSAAWSTRSSKSADPANLLLRYLDLLKAGEDVVYTDIPREMASAFVDLALKVKDAKVKSVVFRSSDQFSSADPDFDWMRDTVQRALDPPQEARLRRAATRPMIPRTRAPTSRPARRSRTRSPPTPPTDGASWPLPPPHARCPT